MTHFKTFDDLKFNPHKICDGTHAIINFNNGYGVSVVCGEWFYSNGVDTYELAILYNGRITYDTGITDDVMGYLSSYEVTDIMKKVQEL